MLQDFDTVGLAKLAYGLAAVGYDDDALYTAITTSAASNLDSMSPAEVSMILWACGEQGHLCDKFMSGEGNCSSSLKPVSGCFCHHHTFPSLSNGMFVCIGKQACHGEHGVLCSASCLSSNDVKHMFCNAFVMSSCVGSRICVSFTEPTFLCRRLCTAVVNEYLPANISSFTPQQLQTAVRAWNKLGYTNPAVAQAATRLDEILPHLNPDLPQAEEPVLPQP